MPTKGQLGSVALACCALAFACENKSSSSAGSSEAPVVVASPERAAALATVAPLGKNTATAGSTPGAALPAQSSILRRVKTVFVVLFENKVWSEVKGSADAPFMNQELLPRASIAEAYRGALGGALHPSEPNYVWLEAGSNLGISDDQNPDANHLATHDHLVAELDKASVSWRAYQEDIAGDECPLEPRRAYMPKHNPMVFFDDVTGANDPHARYCIEHMRPLEKPPGFSGSTFESDLKTGKLARYNFITPNLCNDMHTSCAPLHNPIRQGDDWMAKWIPLILESKAYKDDGAIFITWDEAEYAEHCASADCPVGMLVLSPLAKGGGFVSSAKVDHSSTLRTFQEIFGVRPFLGGAATATDLSDLFRQ